MRKAVSKISRVYALAIFESYQESLLNDFDQVVSIMSLNEKELYNTLSSPLLHSELRSRMISDVFKGRISREMLSCLMLVSDKKRIKYVYEIYELYKTLVDSKNGIVHGDLKVSDKTSDNDEEAIVQVISSILGKKAKIDFIKDENIIAGFSGIVGDRFMDYSVKGHLKQLEDELK